MEVIFINNDTYIIVKGRVEPTLGEVLKNILTQKNMTQQDLIDIAVKDFVLQNIHLVISKDIKGSK